MNARFLLGPAGSGKTFRCLAEIRAQLRALPDGPPLILLAPKQATFQLERQLLQDASLPGFTRLRILSFERLAKFVLELANQPLLPLLSEEGRAMVLRALLARRRDELKIFRDSAIAGGFARQLSQDLRELQQHQLSPERLASLSEALPSPLKEKLQDLQLLLGSYLDWLRDRRLQDADCLLDLAAEALRHRKVNAAMAEAAANPPVAGQLDLFDKPPVLPGAVPAIRLGALWLDGFAEMTPQELSLLTEVAACCETATLAFCVDPATDASPSGNGWLSIWSGVNETRIKCRQRLQSVPGVRMSIEPLSVPARFERSPALRHLERHWTSPEPFQPKAGDASLRLVSCANPAGEAVLAAHEILRFVRAGGRYREAAVLVRRMEGYHNEIRRAFASRGIPCFLDRRESVAHHPLAELVRYALSTIAFDWRHDDWFGALKTGFVSASEAAVDRLENEALARGWKGRAWFEPLRFNGEDHPWAERFREEWMGPFLQLKADLSGGGESGCSGRELAAGLRAFWKRLRVDETLNRWSGEAHPDFAAPHATVWDQMNSWLQDVELAFPSEALPLREWLPILEASLSGLTVGVIPPSLDQVLIGAVDRSRNPELKLVILLGVNEAVFPGVADPVTLLTETERDLLQEHNVLLGAGLRQLLSRERFLGYIAYTRSSERLVVSFSRYDSRDVALNPSPFISHIRSLFPGVEIETLAVDRPWFEAEHASELTAPLLRARSGGEPGLSANLKRPPLLALSEKLTGLSVFSPSLSTEAAVALYGTTLTTSVSRLEQFAACPFKHFIASGLRAEEREEFELDARKKGNFMHAVLAAFHQEIRSQGRRWHDLTRLEAGRLVADIAARLAVDFSDGLLDSDTQSRVALASMTQSLVDFVDAMMGWMAQYEFEPEAAELSFGLPEAALPAWELDLGEGRKLVFRGTIDRIDLCRLDGGETALAVVVDYKSSGQKLEDVMMRNGLQLQLPAYLAVLRRLSDPRMAFGVRQIRPAGVFYVNLRGGGGGGRTRAEVLEHLDELAQEAYQHAGRFDFSALSRLDNRRAETGTQFKYRLTRSGKPYASSPDPMMPEDFAAMLDHVETCLSDMGRKIFSGVTAPDPYQKGTKRACERCEFQGICRIDPWVHAFRALQ